MFILGLLLSFAVPKNAHCFSPVRGLKTKLFSVVNRNPLLFGFALGVFSYVAYNVCKRFLGSLFAVRPMPRPVVPNRPVLSDPQPVNNPVSKTNSVVIGISEENEKIQQGKLVDGKFVTAPTFDQIYQLCQNFPKYHDIPLNASGDVKYGNTFLTQQEFERVLTAFVATMQNSSFGNDDNWIRNNAPGDAFFNLLAARERNQQDFVQKLVLQPDSQIAVHADLHADLFSLLEYVQDLRNRGHLQRENPFRINNPNFYIVFLGDYTDRGYYGAEVLYVIARLKNENPENVILLKGNHEHVGMNMALGFTNELLHKFGPGFNYGVMLNNIYKFLPSAVYVGCARNELYKNFTLLCHAGIEPRYNPRQLLSDDRGNLYQWLDNLDMNWIGPDIKSILDDKDVVDRYDRLNVGNGFFWNDFIVDNGEGQLGFVEGRGHAFGRPAVAKWLERCTSFVDGYVVRCMVTGHQHNNAMLQSMLRNNGLYSSWSRVQWSGQEGEEIYLLAAGPVWTLNVSPCSIYGVRYGYNYDTYAILTLNRRFRDWTIEPCNIEIFE